MGEEKNQDSRVDRNRNNPISSRPQPGRSAPGQSRRHTLLHWTWVLKVILDRDSEVPREQRFPPLSGGENVGSDLL